MALLLLLAAMCVYSGMSDSSKDKEECTPQLTGLAECLLYVQGDANAPSPDCCSGIKDVLKSNKKCLCLVIKDRNDPDLGGIQINVTLALNLPSVCNAPANISKCPGNYISKFFNFCYFFYMYYFLLYNVRDFNHFFLVNF